MKDTLAKYSELANQTSKEVEKLYKGKMEGKELEDEIHSLYLEASVKTKMILDELLKASVCDQEAREIIDDIKNIAENQIDFLFEDSEFYFGQLVELNK